MTARILDGKAVAKQIYDEIAQAVAARVSAGGPRPKLATLLVGDDPASAQYVQLKQKNARQVGIESEDHRVSAGTTTDELLNLIGRLNSDESVSAILVQQPTPAQIDMTRIVLALDPVKDVDGFHPINAGLVALGLPGGGQPCTPAGIIELLDRHAPNRPGTGSGEGRRRLPSHHRGPRGARIAWRSPALHTRRHHRAARSRGHRDRRRECCRGRSEQPRGQAHRAIDAEAQRDSDDLPHADQGPCEPYADR